MLVVTKIETLFTERDFHTIHGDFNHSGLIAEPRSPDELLLTEEHVRGERFINPQNGDDIIIGWSDDVQKALGYPFKAIEEAKQRNNDLYNQYQAQKAATNELVQKIEYLKGKMNSITLWEHLKMWLRNRK